MNNMESIYKILLLVFSIMWAGNMLLFRSERQIIINPILIIIAAVLIFLPDADQFLSMDVEEVKSTLYIAYCVVAVWGLIITRRKTDLF